MSLFVFQTLTCKTSKSHTDKQTASPNAVIYPNVFWNNVTMWFFLAIWFIITETFLVYEQIPFLTMFGMVGWGFLAVWDEMPVAFQKRDISHDDVIKWKHFPRNWPFVRGIHRSPVNSLHKGQWRGALMFSLIGAWINGWVNNREAGHLRRYRTHYDVIVMSG